MLLEDVWFDIIVFVIKEFAQRTIDEAVLRSLQLGEGHGLKKEGKPHFDQFIRDFKAGKQMLFSRHIHMLDGFDYESNILDINNLETVKSQPILIVTNHPYGGPLRGHGQRVIINYYVSNISQKEIRWLHGFDKITLEQLTRNRFARQSNTILVRDKNPKGPSDSIRQAIGNKDIIGIHPEGDGYRTLLRGRPEAGRMIRFCVAKNYSIVCIATRFEKDSFFLTFLPPLDSEKIKSIAKAKTTDRNSGWQGISDYAMARIAKHLPEKNRGCYQNYQDFISAFEAL